MTRINQKDIFYHLYPLGALGAPRKNDFQSLPVARLRQMEGWLDHIQALGATALYLGPVFESGTHGYDTADYYQVDRRLGDRSDLAAFSQALHARGMKLVLDGVFNHVGRQFWAFRDLRANLQGSPYADWFDGLNFDQTSPLGDPFSYLAWNGHFELVKLNLANPAVREHLFGAVAMWKEEFGIDGIRLDAADALSPEFMRELRGFVDRLDPEMWLMGEVIHGDYRNWANDAMLHAVTNYELYKSTYSSFNDGNFFELAHSLKREFGANGIYKHLATIYNFGDNHDVTRLASQLREKRHLYPLYALLFSFPGLPSVYYGSEFGFEAVKQNDDWNLRPAFDLLALRNQEHAFDLREWIGRLAVIRKNSPALMFGDYREVWVASKQFMFIRAYGQNRAVAAVNSADEPARIQCDLAELNGWHFWDALVEGEPFVVQNGCLSVELAPNQVRLLVN